MPVAGMGITVRGMAITAEHGKCSFVISSEVEKSVHPDLPPVISSAAEKSVILFCPLSFRAKPAGRSREICSSSV